VAVEVSPITESELPAVARFLHEHHNRRVPPARWAAALAVPWKVDAPNYGYLLRAADPAGAGAAGRPGAAAADPAGGPIVGAYLAYYSERHLAGRPERFCNLGAWCVLPAYRFHSLRLLKALLAQADYHFTDLSPSGNVVGINTRLGLRHLDSRTALMPNLPWPSGPGRPMISSDPAVIEATLTGAAREIYHDHARGAAAHHLVLARGERWCYVMWRRERRKRLPLFASLLYVSDPALFRQLARPFGRHLLLRHRVPATLVELRTAGRPPGSRLLRAGRPKMYLSARLAPEQIDNLYSELACLAW
jgi:hypothetical protein